MTCGFQVQGPNHSATMPPTTFDGTLNNKRKVREKNGHVKIKSDVSVEGSYAVRTPIVKTSLSHRIISTGLTR